MNCYYIQKLNENIATINIFDTTCQKIHRFKRNCIYTSEIHSVLKVHAGQCKYKHLYYKNIDDDAFKNIIDTVKELCNDYNINYKILCDIFNILGYHSEYDEHGSIDYILECLFIVNDENKYELNYNLILDDEIGLFLDFYDEIYNTSYDEKIDLLIKYFYNTDLRDSFLQAYAVRLIEQMHKDKQYFIKYYNIRYLNHLIQHLSSMLKLDIVPLDEVYDFIFNNEYDMFPDVVQYFTYLEYENDYCNEHNINYEEYITDYNNNQLISLKK